MQYEKDYIQREIQKLNLFLMKLIQKIKGIGINESEMCIHEINYALIDEFDISLEQIAELKPDDLLSKVEVLNDIHLEKLIELLSEIVKLVSQDRNTYGFNVERLASNTIVMVDYLNEMSNVFSMSRMHLRKTLEYNSPRF